jgi:predicted MFS family arabinose efflux permease
MTWTWTFLVNVPLGLAVLLIAPRVVRALPGSRGKVGLIDSALVTGAVVAAVYALVTGEQAGWLAPSTLGLLGAAVGLLGLFLTLQATSRSPLLPLRLFRTPGLAAGNLIMALLGAAWIPLWFFLNLYLQEVLELSALKAGLALLPMTLVIMVMMVAVTGPLVGRLGAKPVMVAGLLALAGALLLLSWVPVEGSFLVSVLPATLVAALGMSLAYIPVTMTGMGGAAPEDAGLASGLINTTYQVGSALGLAAVVSLAATQAGDPAASAVAGYQAAFLGASAVALVATLVALFLVSGPRRVVDVSLG